MHFDIKFENPVYILPELKIHLNDPKISKILDENLDLDIKFQRSRI